MTRTTTTTTTATALVTFAAAACLCCTGPRSCPRPAVVFGPAWAPVAVSSCSHQGGVSKTSAVVDDVSGTTTTATLPPRGDYCESSRIWRRGPRPGKGRNSRTNRRSPSPVAGPAAAAAALLATATTMTAATSTSAAPGYEQYQKSLLEVPWPHAEYGEASSDDLSSEWDSDVPEPPPNSKVNKLPNISIYLIYLKMRPLVYIL